LLLLNGGAYADNSNKGGNPTESFDALLKEIKSQSKAELDANRFRVKRFLDAKEERAALLAEAKVEVERQTLESETLNKQIDKNEQQLSELEEKLHRKMGDLGELFGVIRQISGELGATFSHSMISVHFPDRIAFLQELAERKELPDIDIMNRMWLLMLEELDESRKVTRFTTPIVQADGSTRDQEVVRIGAYGAVSEGDFLTYSPDGNVFVKALQQPAKRYRASARNFNAQDSGLVKVMIDPTRGQLLSMLTEKPGLKERIRQGGIIGYIILFIGAAGLLLCLVRYAYLSLVDRRIQQQVRNLNAPKSDNPLGRIALVYREIGDKPKEQREVIWDEAILKEIPRLEKFNPLIKLLAAVSPLLGLLGTVTGMIITFQSITLFGTSDPKLMAGGISTALITTVLGLTVAIPLLFAYTFIAAKSKSIVDVIEHQSVGMIAKESLI
jgi:biopolymer transport protein ExbB